MPDQELIKGSPGAVTGTESASSPFDPKVFGTNLIAGLSVLDLTSKPPAAIFQEVAGVVQEALLPLDPHVLYRVVVSYIPSIGSLSASSLEVTPNARAALPVVDRFLRTVKNPSVNPSISKELKELKERYQKANTEVNFYNAADTAIDYLPNVVPFLDQIEANWQTQTEREETDAKPEEVASWWKFIGEVAEYEYRTTSKLNLLKPISQEEERRWEALGVPSRERLTQEEYAKRIAEQQEITDDEIKVLALRLHKLSTINPEVIARTLWSSVLSDDAKQSILQIVTKFRVASNLARQLQTLLPADTDETNLKSASIALEFQSFLLTIDRLSKNPKFRQLIIEAQKSDVSIDDLPDIIGASWGKVSGRGAAGYIVFVLADLNLPKGTHLTPETKAALKANGFDNLARNVAIAFLMTDIVQPDSAETTIT